MALFLKVLGVNTVSKAIKTQSFNTQYFQTRNHLKVVGVTNLSEARKMKVSTHNTFMIQITRKC